MNLEYQKKLVPLLNLLLLFVILIPAYGRQPATYKNPTADQFLVSAQTVVYQSFPRIHPHFIDQTQAYPDSMFSDSFYTAAATAFLVYELKKHFKTVLAVPDSLLIDSTFTYSLLNHDTCNFIPCSSAISSILRSLPTNALYCRVIEVTAKDIVIRPQGFRDGKFEGSYSRPDQHRSKVTVHLQLFDKHGTLLFEKKVLATNSKPFGYTVLKTQKIKNNDIVKYANRLYAPPILKAMARAMRSAIIW